MTLLYIWLWGILPCAISIYDTWALNDRPSSVVLGLFWPVWVSIALFDKIFE